MGATERRGNLFAFLVTMTTAQGKQMIVENLKKHKIPYGPFIKTIKLSLAYEKWIHDNNSKRDVHKARKWVVILKTMITKHLDRSRLCLKGNGWNIPKFHGLSKFIFYMTVYGSGSIFFGGPCECSLKEFVKKTAFNTQRRTDTFCTQVAQRNHENIVVRNGYERVRHKCGDHRDVHSDTVEILMDDENEEDTEEVQDDNSCSSDITVEDVHLECVDDSAFEGVHDIIFSAIMNPISWNRSYVSKWKDGRKNTIQTPINEEMISALNLKAKRDGIDGKFSVTAYTCYKQDMDGKKVIYRASSNYRGSEWYDFCLIKYSEVGFYPAKILGFLKYPDKEQMFAAVLCAKYPLTTEEIDESFITTFQLGETEESYDVVPVESIENPMLAIKSYGEDKIKKYITATPYESWGLYFKQEMKRITKNDNIAKQNAKKKYNETRNMKRKKQKLI